MTTFSHCKSQLPKKTSSCFTQERNVVGVRSRFKAGDFESHLLRTWKMISSYLTFSLLNPFLQFELKQISTWKQNFITKKRVSSETFCYSGNIVLKRVIYCLFDIQWKKFRTIIWSKSLYPAGISCTFSVQRWNVIYSGICFFFSLSEEAKNSFFHDKFHRKEIGL